MSETRAGKGVRRPVITHRVKYLLVELQKVYICAFEAWIYVFEKVVQLSVSFNSLCSRQNQQVAIYVQ